MERNPVQNPVRGDQDRFSELPDELMVPILSFLTTIEAVQTTAVCKKLKDKWKAVKCLDFDNRNFADNVERFVTFVNRVLLFRNKTEIDTFRLRIYSEDYIPCIPDWISTAVRSGAVELDLRISSTEFNRGDYYHHFVLYPECIFMPWLCKRLRLLRLNMQTSLITVYDYDDNDSSDIIPWCCPSLEFLHVSVKNPQLQPMDKLLSCCPILQGLTIDGTYDAGVDEDSNIKVYAAELKTLKINLRSEGDPTIILIKAPKLKNLNVELVGDTDWTFEGTSKSIVNADITLRDHGEGEDQTYLVMCVKTLLDHVSNVESLSLSVCCSIDWRLPKDWCIPTYSKMKQLRLVFWDCRHWELLVGLLNSAPTLEIFNCELRTNSVKESTVSAKKSTNSDKRNQVPQWIPPNDVPVCLSSHLKYICIRGFRARRIDFETARYLLTNGPHLKKMTIYTDSLQVETKNKLKRFFVYCKASGACEVEVN